MRNWVTGLVVCAGVLATRLAYGFDAQLFSPAVDPQGYFSVYSSRTAPEGRYYLGAWYDFAEDPGDFGVDRMHTINLVGSYSLIDAVEIGIDMPFSTVDTDLAGVDDELNVDDIRIVGKFQVMDNRRESFGLAIVPILDLPTGSEDSATASGDFGFGGIGVLDLVRGRWRGSLNLGYEIDEDISDEGRILFGTAFGYLIVRDERMLGGAADHLELMFEAFGNADDDEIPVEILTGARLYGPSGFFGTLGVGTEINSDAPSADLRLLASIAYAPPPPPIAPPAPRPPAPAAPPPPYSGVVVTDEQIVTLEPIYFDFAKATIQPESDPILDSVARVMRDRASIRVRVEGHTDAVGSSASNQSLSERRSAAVVRALISRGVSAARLDAVGFGESRPIASNDSDEGRARNRRTEFHILK